MQAAGSSPNPLQTIWFQPRETMRWITASAPNRTVIVLAAAGGAAYMLIEQAFSVPESAWLWLFWLAVGAVDALLKVFIMAPILRRIGGKYGKQTPTAAVRAALAWPYLPWIVLAVPYLLFYFALVARSVNSGTPVAALSLEVAQFASAIGLVASGIITIWVYVLQLVCLSEVLGLSKTGAFFALFAAGLCYLPIEILVQFLMLSVGEYVGSI